MNKAVFYKAYEEADQFPKDIFVIEFRDCKLESYGDESCICCGKDVRGTINTILKRESNIITNVYKRLYDPENLSVNGVFVKTEEIGLVGYDKGVQMYLEQVKGEIDIRTSCKIIFPENVKRLSTSFLRGMFEEFINDVGLQAVQDRVEVLGMFHMDDLWDSLLC